MPRAGFCSECRTHVWLTDEGACANGHPSECVSGEYDGGAGPGVPSPQPARKRAKGAALTFALIGLIAFCASTASITGLIKREVVQPFVAGGNNNAPTIVPGDRVLIDKRSKAQRGDLIAFRDPTGQYPALLSRVIGVGGDTIDVHEGHVYINGDVVDEPYAQGTTVPGTLPLPMTIPEGHVFVLGDNRPNSADSRYFGPVPSDDVLGRISLIYWPQSRYREF